MHQEESQGQWGQVKYLCTALYSETPTQILTVRKLKQEDYYFKSSLGYIRMFCSQQTKQQTNKNLTTTPIPLPNITSKEPASLGQT